MFQRAFLKWPGGKFRVLDKILSRLPSKKQLIEPFLGSAVVFMNTEYEHYLLSDVNPDLMNVYQQLKHEQQSFIDYARTFFTAKNNQPKHYYSFRRKFNESADPAFRAAIFLYLNRHGFNGLCRYNLSGGYNVPFGQYPAVYFPEAELKRCQVKLARATLRCGGFEESMNAACEHSVVYGDPPYVPLSSTAQFTAYAQSPFGEVEQRLLADKARMLAKRGVSVLLSNHDTPFTRAIYEGALIDSFQVQRHIAAKAQSRQPVRELLALFTKETS